ncbi:MAG: hypothetical protein QOE37_468 [Microbacteriaceae bacterium]|jgi:hypothetical protein|nr:hypothetical protein [Microbacteriaceae bacterium]
MPMFAVVAGVFAAWLCLSFLAAIAFGQAVRLADRRRPRVGTGPSRSRDVSRLGRAGGRATGAVPLIRPILD